MYDLVVTVVGPPSDERWSLAEGYADLTAATFWEHPEGGDIQPDSFFFSWFGLLRFDSFWTCPEEWPNPDLNPDENATYLLSVSMSATERDAVWFTDPSASVAGPGTYTIARYCFLPVSDSWALCVSGNVWLISTGGTPYPFDLCVGEEPPPPTGACCYPSGECVEEEESSCGGVFMGEGTDCDPNPCPTGVILKLFIEDAAPGHGVIWKAPGDLIDIVADLSAVEALDEPVITVTFITDELAAGALQKCFIRADFHDTAEVDVTSDCSQVGSTIVYQGASWNPAEEKQVVFRVQLPSDAPPDASLDRYVEASVSLGGGELDQTSERYRVPNHVSGLIVTNRAALYSTYGGSQARDDAVQALLSYLYDVAVGYHVGTQRCIVYYVDHYHDGSELTEFIVDADIETWLTRTWVLGNLMLVGGSEVIPFFTFTDSLGSFTSDIRYADTDGSWIDGRIELNLGRIVGDTATQVRTSLMHGIEGRRRDHSRGIVATGSNWPWDSCAGTWDSHDMRQHIKANGWSLVDEDVLANSDWTIDDLAAAFQDDGGPQLFVHGFHSAWNCIQADACDFLAASSVDSSLNPNDEIAGNRPFVALFGCNAGVVPPIGNHCMVRSFFASGASGVLGAGGITYSNPWGGLWGLGGCRGAEVFGREYMRAVTSGQVTVASAYRQATERYGGVESDAYGRRTVQEFIVYGVPWTCVGAGGRMSDGGSGKREDQIVITTSDPVSLGGGAYYRTVEVQVLGYDVASVGGYELIVITGVEQHQHLLKPVVPVGATDLSLPADAVVLDVDFEEGEAGSIGQHDLPCSNAVEGTNFLGFGDETDVQGYYPQDLSSWSLLVAGDSPRIALRLFPVQHDPATRDTLLRPYMRFRVTYQTSARLAISEMLMEQVVTVGEPFEAHVTLENAGAETLSDLRVVLTLEHGETGGTLSGESSSITVEPGAATEVVVATNDASVYGGSYLATVQVLGADHELLAEGRRSVFVSAGQIVQFTHPARIEPGEEVPFVMLFRNDEPVDIEAAGIVRVYDWALNQVAEIWSGEPVLVPAGQTAEIAVTWTDTVVPEGEHVVRATVYTSSAQYQTPSTRLTISSAVLGDLDADRDVDAQDFWVFVATWGRCVGNPDYNEAADYDEDGCVTIVDYQTWLEYYRCFIGDPDAPPPGPPIPPVEVKAEAIAPVRALEVRPNP